MMYRLTILLFALCITITSWCQTTNIQFIHAAPAMGANAGPEVDIYINGILSTQLSQFEFGTATEYLSVPTGPTTVAVALHPSNSVADSVFRVSLGDLTASANYLAVLYTVPDDMDQPLRLAVRSPTSMTTAEPNSVALSGFHGVTDVNSLLLRSRRSVPFADDLSLGAFSAYTPAMATTHYFDVIDAASEVILGTYLADLAAYDGEALQLVATGFRNNTPDISLFAVRPSGEVVQFSVAAIASMQVINDSPGALLDVYLDDVLIADDLEYLAATPTELFAVGTDRQLVVTAHNNDSPLLSRNLDFANGTAYIAMIYGVVGDAETPLALRTTPKGQLSANTAGAFDLLGFHGSPVADTINLIDPGNDLVLESGVGYGSFTSGYFPFFPVPTILQVEHPTAADTQLGSFFFNFTGGAGLAGVIFSGGDPTIDVPFNLYLALTNGTVIAFVPSVFVQLIHNAPAADLETIDVYAKIGADHTLIADDLPYRGATAFRLFSTRIPIEIGIAPATSEGPEDIVFTVPDTLMLQDGFANVLVAEGIPGDATTPFSMELYEQAKQRAEAADEVAVLFYHGGPDAGEIDITSSPTEIIFDNVAYRSFSDDVALAAGATLLRVTPASDNIVATRTYDANFTDLAGDAITLFASGYLTDQSLPAFQLWVAEADGSTYPLSEISAVKGWSTNLQRLKVFPNPANRTARVDFELTNATNVYWRLYNSKGQATERGDLGRLSPGNYGFELSAQEIPTGPYRLVLYGADGIATHPLLIVK